MKGRKKPDIGQLLVSMAVAILLGCQGVLCAAEATPEKLQGVGIAEQLGNSIDLSLPFTEETGKPITLGKYFDGTHPVLLVMAYYECPMLCTLVLNGVAKGLRSIPWKMGEDFRVVTVSIDPSETPSMAAKKQQAYVASYGKKVTDGGWSFLTGTKDNIAALAKSIGFKYRRDPETGQYAHAAAVTFLTPDGKVARYLYGIDYRPQDLRLALAEAGKGHVGGIVDRLLLYCFHYDPQGKKYSLFAVNLLKGTAGVAVLLLGLMVWRLRRRES